MNISNVLQYTSKRHYYDGPRNLIKDEVSNNKVDDPISYKHFRFNSLKSTDFSGFSCIFKCIKFVVFSSRVFC